MPPSLLYQSTSETLMTLIICLPVKEPLLSFYALVIQQHVCVRMYAIWSTAAIWTQIKIYLTLAPQPQEQRSHLQSYIFYCEARIIIRFAFYIVQSVCFCWSSFNILYIQYTAFSFLRFNEVSGFNRNRSGPLITKCGTWLRRHFMQFFHEPITPTLWLVTLLFIEGCPRTGPLQWLKTLFQIPSVHYLRHWFCPLVSLSSAHKIYSITKYSSLPHTHCHTRN